MSKFINAELESDSEPDSEPESESDTELMTELDILLLIIFTYTFLLTLNKSFYCYWLNTFTIMFFLSQTKYFNSFAFDFNSLC